MNYVKKISIIAYLNIHNIYLTILTYGQMTPALTSNPAFTGKIILLADRRGGQPLSKKEGTIADCRGGRKRTGALGATGDEFENTSRRCSEQIANKFTSQNYNFK